MIRFIENIGDYFSQHFFDDGFPKKVFDRSGYVYKKKDKDGNPLPNHVIVFNKRIAPLREKYYRFKNDFLALQRPKDQIKLTHDFHTDVLKALGYTNGHLEYEYPVYLNETEVIPVRYRFTKGNKPFLFVMEMQAMIQRPDHDLEGIYDQVYELNDWEKVFPESWAEYTLKPDVIDEALSELFLLDEDERPTYVILLAGPKIFLLHYEKWKYDSFLLFDLEELFTESQVASNKDYLALLHALKDDWPAFQLLYDLHPIARWMQFKLLAKVDKGKALIARMRQPLPPQSAWFVFQGITSNGQGKPILSKTFVIGRSFTGQSVGSLDSFAEFVSEYRLRDTLPALEIPQDQIVSIQTMLPDAVRAAKSMYKFKLQGDLEDEMEEKFRLFRSRLENWVQASEQQLDLKFGEEEKGVLSYHKDRRRKELNYVHDQMNKFYEEYFLLENDPFLRVLAVFYNA